MKTIYICLLSILLTACGPKPEEELKKAADLLAGGNYAQALQQYQAISQQYSEPEIKAQSRFWLANINLLYLDNVQEAIKGFEDFVHDYPRHPLALKAYWEIAAAYRDVFKDKRRAILKYQEVIDHFPHSAEAARAQLAIARCYAELGDNQQAILEAEQVLEAYPQNPQLAAALFFLADTRFLMGEYPQAKESYQKLIRNYPQNELVTEAWMGLATTQEELKENQAALKSYQRIKDRYPNRELIARRMERLQETIKKESKKLRMKW